MHHGILVAILAYSLQQCVQCSEGDRQRYHVSCVYECELRDCEIHADEYDLIERVNKRHFNEKQPLYLRLLGWNCHEECVYDCMWRTLTYLQQQNSPRILQFYGKWPFIRILGIQEPLSAIASLIHIAVVLHMFKRMRKEISNYSQLKYLWYGSAIFNLNTWLWSTVFHSRDIAFTERMDYFSAFALVLFQFNSFFLRHFTYNYKKRLLWVSYLVCLLSVVYFTYHIYYLTFINFDYNYNMKANIVVGLLNSICWFVWSIHAYVYRRRVYAWNCFVATFLIVFLMIFEIYDFEPIWFVIDSHALWHLTTISVHFYLFQFYIDDCNYYNRGGFYHLE